jgi:thiol-disulfide isomerase/thioredoxin
MNKLLFCLMLILGASASLHAQITLSGKVTNVPPTLSQVLAIEYWNFDRWQQIDVANLEKDGTFSKPVFAPANAQCRLRISNKSKNWSDFILPGAEDKTKELVFNLDFFQMNGGPARIAGSEENELYYRLASEYKSLSHLRDSLGANGTEALEGPQRAFNESCQEIAKRNKGTFSADVVANSLYQPAKEDYPGDAKVAAMTPQQFAIEHALDKTPFRYARSLHFNGFMRDLDKYFNYFDRTPEAYVDYIQRVMAKRNGSEEVDNFLFKYLLDKMMDYKDETGLTYLLNWYVPDCADESPLPSSTQNLLESLKNCKPGKIAYDLKLPGIDSQWVSLNSVCSKNKITLLLFWRSTCSHCKEFEPILAKLYEKYHPLGVEVYAISSDRNTEEWKKFLAEHPTNWVNVYTPFDRRTEVSKAFPSISTPTLISVDRNRKVLSRMIMRNDIEAYLDETLKKVDQ